MVWDGTETGLFSTKSAYELLMAQLTPSSSSPNPIWKILWYPRLTRCIPPKVMLFVRKSIRNLIPTNANIPKTIPRIDFRCQICLEVEESIHHLLFFCQAAIAVWKSSSLNLHSDKAPLDPVELILYWTHLSPLQDATDYHHLIHVFSIMWQIWKARCSNAFNKVPVVPKLVAARTFAEAPEWLSTVRVPAKD